MKVLVTGANGFIGKNLVLRLRERADTEVLTLMREDGDSAWQAALRTGSMMRLRPLAPYI